MSFITKVKNDFTLISVLLIPVAVAINFVGGQLAMALKLPIYLDSIGTILVGLIAGPWVGAATGLLTSVMNGILAPTYIGFAPISILIGITAGLLSKYKMMSNPIKIVVSIIIMLLVVTLPQVPIIIYGYNGATGTGSAAVTAAFMKAGDPLWIAVWKSTILSEFIDKPISLIVAFLTVLSMASRYLSKFKYGEQYMRKNKKTNIDEIV